MAKAYGINRCPAQQPGLRTIVEFATSSHVNAALVLLVVAFLSFIPGLFQIPPVDRDEARFAQATKQMIESGDYAQYIGNPYKPV